MTPTEYLGAQNALFNATAAFCLIMGYRAIRAGKRDTHRRWMLTALGAAGFFLLSYLTRVIFFPHKPFAGEGIWRTVYFSVLGSHTILAAFVPPLAIASIFLANKMRFETHKKIARITLPLWLYVSVTGILVYFMLFQIFV